MNICFLLHFYQPSNQLESVTKKIIHECYLPLIKLIKNDKRIRLTANLPLALLAQLDSYGQHALLADIKELVKVQRVELTGSGAYHPLFTKIPDQPSQQQIILNETAQAYYFGMNKDFEGEACFMIRDLRGFFPPEMAVNEGVVDLVGSLGYSWMVVDEGCLPKDVLTSHTSGRSYRLSTHQVNLIVRDRALSNDIAFKRDQNIETIVDKMSRSDADVVIALDAEAFGHHYRDGIYLFESIVSEIYRNGMQTATISQTYEKTESKVISGLEESTWSCVDAVNPYPLWESGHVVNRALWELFSAVHTELQVKYAEKLPELKHGVDLTPVWKPGADQENGIMAFLKSEQSDQFWWSSGVTVGDKVAYSPYMVSSVLTYYREVVSSLGLDGGLSVKIDNVKNLVASSDNPGSVI